MFFLCRQYDSRQEFWQAILAFINRNFVAAAKRRIPKRNPIVVRAVVLTGEHAQAVFLATGKIREIAEQIFRLIELDPPPINESMFGVNPDRFWTVYRRSMNGKEALYGGADYRSSASG